MLLSVPGGVDVWFAGHCHGSLFRWMSELTVTALRPSQIPAPVLQQPDEVPDFHARIIKGFSGSGKENV